MEFIQLTINKKQLKKKDNNEKFLQFNFLEPINNLK